MKLKMQRSFYNGIIICILGKYSSTFNSYKRHESRFYPIGVENEYLPTFDEELQYTNGPIIYVIEGRSGLKMMKVLHLGKCYELNEIFP